MGRLKLPLALAVFTAAAFFAASGHWPWHRLVLEPAPALSTVAPALARPVTESLDTLHRWRPCLRGTAWTGSTCRR